MNRKIIPMLALVSVLLTAGTASAQELIQPMPGYYGSITVNGQPAAPGTTIIAKIAGEVRGSITTAKSGFYGDEPNPEASSPAKLWITGYTNEIGSTITFYINNNVAAPQTTQLGRNGTRLDLTFTVAGGGPSGGGPSGGGGGGGGITSGEPFGNIEFSETQEADLRIGIPITFRFRDPRHVVYEIVITANTSAGLIGAKIEQLKGTSGLVTSPPPGAIFKNMNIWLGSSGFAVPRNIREGIIRFRVNNSWLDTEKVDAKTVSMQRWDGSKWYSLETRLISSDETFTYYEAMTNSFSPFAVRGVKAEATETIPAGTTPQPSPTETPAVKPPAALNWILYALVAVAIIAAVYYFVLRKKEK